MSFTSIDHALELGIREQAIRDHRRRQMGPIGGLRRRNRGHGSRLHEPRRMGLRAGNTDRLKDESFIKRIRDAAVGFRRPVDGFVGELDCRRLNNRRDQSVWRFAFEGGACRRRSPSRRWRNESDGLRCHCHSRGNERRDPLEQRGGVACDPWRLRKFVRIVSRHPIDDDEPRLGGRAMTGIDSPVDRRREHDTSALLQSHERVAPGWIVG